MLEFENKDDGSIDVIYSCGVICVLRKTYDGWQSDEHDTETFYYPSGWHRQIADKLDELNKP